MTAAHRPHDRALSCKGARYHSGRTAASVRAGPGDLRADGRRGVCDSGHTAIRRRVHHRQRPCGRDGFARLGSAARRRAAEWRRDVNKSRTHTQTRSQPLRSRPAHPSSACSAKSARLSEFRMLTPAPACSTEFRILIRTLHAHPISACSPEFPMLARTPHAHQHSACSPNSTCSHKFHICNALA